ncbi:hypothetical protein Hanom_Chr08g00722421 [Helianthus anomalus]
MDPCSDDPRELSCRPLKLCNPSEYCHSFKVSFTFSCTRNMIILCIRSLLPFLRRTGGKIHR